MPREKAPSNEIIDSDTVLVDDRWLYRWSGEAPRDFLLYKTIYRALTPGDIAANGWQVLTPAVTELAKNLDIGTTAPPVDWLKLDAVPTRRCLIGVHADRTVVAARPLHADPGPFIPHRFYETIRNNPEWRDLRFEGSYRHLLVRFHTGLTFCTDRLGLLCDVDYGVHFGIGGVHSLWSNIRIGETSIAVPLRIRVSESLIDLPGKAEYLARFGQSFVAKLGAAWLPVRDQESLWEFVVSTLQSGTVPAWRLNELRRDERLAACATMLDLLLFLAGMLRSGPAAKPTDMLNLSRNLFATINRHA